MTTQKMVEGLKVAGLLLATVAMPVLAFLSITDRHVLWLLGSDILLWLLLFFDMLEVEDISG